MKLTRLSLSRRKLIVGMTLLIAALYGVWWLWQRDEVPRYLTYTVTVGDLQKTITALGNLQPKQYVDVGTQVSGQLKRVYVKIGDPVEKGQLLAEIDPTVYATKVEADRATLKDLQAQLNKQRALARASQQDYHRTQTLYKAGVASRKALEAAQAAYLSSSADVDSINAQLSKAQSALNGDMANLGYTKIYAPMAGTIVDQTVLQGQTINASQSAPTLLRIANLAVMTVNAQVAEADVARLKVAMPVYFMTLGDDSRRWYGTVRQILPTPVVTNNVVLYTVLIDVDNHDSRLMTQMTAQVFFVEAQCNQLPIVPLTALQPIDQDDKHYAVQVLTAGKVEKRKITVALANRTYAAVTSGLKAGETVVVGVVREPSSNKPSVPRPIPRIK